VSLRIEPYGDAAVLVRLGETFSERRWNRVHRLAATVRTVLKDTVTDVIPTYASVLVEFDPLRTAGDEVAAAVKALIDHATDSDTEYPTRTARVFVIPVVYGGPFGPDLKDVAHWEGMTPEELVEAHTRPAYRIRCLGTPVGEPLLDGPPLPRPVPRRPTPRTRVPSGSVALAGRQATIYTGESPGGWALIGQTPLRFARPIDPPVPYRPGDIIRFLPIPPHAFAQWQGVPVEAVEAPSP
jgi:KipI family sensor histidine kinase inhibitor